MTPRNRPTKSPARRRSRSRTPGGRKQHRTSTENFRAVTQEDEEIQILSPGNHRVGDAAVTVIPNSSGPQMLSDTATQNNGNADNKKSFLSKLSGTIYESIFQKEQNKVEELEQRNEMLGERNDELVEENRLLRRDVKSLMRSIELKSIESSGLRNKLVQLGQNGASGGQRSGSGDNQNLDYGPTAELQQKIAEYEDHVRNLEAQNTQLLRNASDCESHIQSQTAQFARELEDIRGNDFRAPKVSDSEIQGKWKALGFAVRQFVSKHLPESLDLPAVQHIAQQEEFKWLPEISKTLRYPFLCSIVLESWVWHFLCFRIFDSHSEFWAGDIGQGFSMLKDRVESEKNPFPNELWLGTHVLLDHISSFEDQSTSRVAAVSQLHDWRVRSSHFISQLDTHDENSSARLVADMLCLLKHTLPWVCPKNWINEVMYQDILAIVHKAAELDRIFRMSKAHFHVFITRLKEPLVHPPSFGFEFDSETMECVRHMNSTPRGNGVPIVDLAVSPGILKAGNSVGANHEVERVLAKLQAFCDLQWLLAHADSCDSKEEERGDEQQDLIKHEREENCDVDMLFPRP